MIARIMLLAGGALLSACTSVIGWNDLSFSDAGTGVVIPCNGKTCVDLQLECGAAPDGCGKTVLCGKCGSGLQCGGGGTNLCGTHPCTPLTCADVEVCGVVSDGCAATIDCSDKCSGPCEAGTCESKGAKCGTIDDGCGVQLSCGECTAPATCKNNQCTTGVCTPSTCAQQGAECGTLGDGCGTDLDCGTCASGSCSGNKCNCVPKSCAELGATCGSISDGCGSNIDCGTCSPTESCGGGGTPNQCGGSDAQFCVDTINQYRASIGRPPLQRWSSAESCSDGEAKSDAQTQTPHGAFGQCGESGQNECPGWPGPLKDLLAGCLQMMWDEGPGGGHYENMASAQFTGVACGFSASSGSSIWALQNFH